MVRHSVPAIVAWMFAAVGAVQSQAALTVSSSDLVARPSPAPDLRFPASVAVHETDATTALPESPYTPLALSNPLDITAATSDATKLESASRPYHAVCDCNCLIPSLDHWCVCDVPCGTTQGCATHCCTCAHGNCYLTESGSWISNDAWCDVGGREISGPETAVRLGWWGVGTDGSLNKTGEFQDLRSSPFWDLDTISSDGVRTWDITLSGLDNEANDGRVGYYSPGLSADIEFQRYLRRWDHDPLTGFDPNGPVPPGPADNVITDDLNVGEDYAIRVQELDAKFQGRLTDNLKWRLNVWSQRKFGERQSNATAHCFNANAPGPAGANGNVCHVLSQRQTIDWVVVEVQPVVEASFEDITVEYSRTMRGFAQDDGSVDRQYTRFGFSPASGALGPSFDYGVVPESFTQIDRVKVGVNLTDDDQLYANVYHGDTKNDFRDTHRDYSGYDVRLTNNAFEQITLTAYTSLYDETNDFPPFFLTSPPLAPAGTYDQDSLRHPVDYTRTRAGVKSSWRPGGDSDSRGSSYGWDSTALVSGYEYYLLERDFATYDTALGPFTQGDTKTHQIELGPSTRWSRSVDTYVRYKVRFIEDPLIGVRENSGGFNTNQPEQVHATDVGFTWTPSPNLVTNAQFSLVNSWHDSEFANFNEDDYPLMLTAWVAPTQRLSLTSGYYYFSNWIDQDITLGFTVPNVPVPPVRTETTRWSYSGENHLFNVGANYAWSRSVQLIGGFEWNRGTNVFNVPPSPAGADWSLLPLFSDAIVETQRLTAGVDWQPLVDTTVYVRYNYFDYDDISAGLYSGVAHMALAGATRTW